MLDGVCDGHRPTLLSPVSGVNSKYRSGRLAGEGQEGSLGLNHEDSCRDPPHSTASSSRLSRRESSPYLGGALWGLTRQAPHRGTLANAALAIAVAVILTDNTVASTSIIPCKAGLPLLTACL